MKPLRHFIRWFGCVVWLLALAGPLRASTVTADSGNTTVDTRDGTTGAPPAVTITMRRATKNVLENADASALPDDALRVKATTPAMLASQPLVPAWNSTTGTGGGLVADGVTPLIFRIVASTVPPPGGARYEVSLNRKTFPAILLTNSNAPKLSMPGSSLAGERIEVTLTTAQPETYVVLNPIRAEDLATVFTGPVVAQLNVRDATTGNLKGGIDFGISRPPVVLVHGYNVDTAAWGSPMTTALAVDRAPGFVIPVGYGLPDENTNGSLSDLTRLLHRALLYGIETEGLGPAVLGQWAWTRYDAVGHSQGGVLLRLLCSTENKVGGGTVRQDGFEPWRSAGNKFRGRFHRVVTIGSPHAGSTLV